MIDIKRATVHALKMIFCRCGIRVASENALRYSTTNNLPDSQSVKKQKITPRRSRYSHQLLLLVTLVLGVFSQAQAGEFCVANPQFNGVIDASVVYSDPPLDTLTQVTIDGDCTFKNFTADNPLDFTINFQTNDDSIYLITFDNVFFDGNMSCPNIDHKLWIVNSTEDAMASSCQDIAIPSEAIDKQIPASTAAIGAPFTYRLTLPSMELTGLPSIDDIGNITLIDDLNAMFEPIDPNNPTAPLPPPVDVTLVGTPVVTWASGAAATHTLNNTDGLLTFGLPNIPAGEQIFIDITVVLDDTANNISGKQFVNVATWTFSKAIDINEDGIITADEFFDPLPGESGINLPMTIDEPDLIVTKSSSTLTTALNLGITANYTIDVHNVGGADAWHATIIDKLPNIDATVPASVPPIAPVGMCDVDPIKTMTVRIVAGDGTPISGLLSPGSDYSVDYTFAPDCLLRLTMLNDNAVIGPAEHLIISFETQLDVDTTRDGYTLSNVAAATEWFTGDGSYPRLTYTKPLAADADGTPGIVDHQDNYDITSALTGYYFQKTVQNITTGEGPVDGVVLNAAPSDTLHYQLRLYNVDKDINSITISDVLDPTKFDLSTFKMLVSPAGSTFNFDPVTGELQVFGFPTPSDLSLVPGAEIFVDFEIKLATAAIDGDPATGLINGDIVPNEATLVAFGPLEITSDNPYINKTAAPGDPTDTTDVVIQAPGPLLKVKPVKNTASIGEQLTYTITVPAVAVDVPLYDVRIIDNLSSVADLSYVSVSAVSLDGSDTWTLTPTVTPTSVTLEEAATGMDIPANGQAIIKVTLELQNTTKNQAGIVFNNTASYTYNRKDGNIATQTLGVGATSADISIVEPFISTITKSANKTTPTAGEIVRYSVVLDTSSGAGFSDVFDVTITDSLSAGLVYEGNPTVTVGAGISADNTIAAPDITGDGSTASPQILYWSFATGNADIDIIAGSSITISYDVRLLDSVLANQTLTNSAVAQWTSIDATNTGERNGIDGIGLLNDYTTAPAVVTLNTPDIISTITKVRSSDTYGATDNVVRIGDLVEYSLTLAVPEGTLGNLQLVDTLPQGLKFEGVVSINGNTGPAPYVEVSPFTHTAIAAANITGDPIIGPSTVSWNLGNVTNLPTIDGLSNNFVIIYRARVLDNVFALTTPSTSLNNTVVMSYDTAIATVTNSDIDTIITALQPNLTVSKSALPVGGDTIVDAGEIISYTVDVINSGSVPAYDTVVQDILPVGMRQGGVTTTSITLLAAGTTLTNFNPAYDLASGTAIWNFDSGVADAYTIPAGDTLRIVYQTQVDAVVGQGLTLTNAATATLYYSFDDEAVPSLGTVTGVREIYGPSEPATTILHTSSPPTKTLISSAETTIGDEVVYEITVPGTVATSALHDVQITDVLDANLELISASVTGVAVAADTSTATQMNIAITEIPAGKQAVIKLRTRVRNITSAQQGVAINNTASYTYAYSAGGTAQAALSSTNVVVNIVEPQLVLTKTAANTTNPSQQPTAGDILRYTLTLIGSSGVNFSDIFDVSVDDTLSLGLAYSGNPVVTGIGNTIGAPVIVGDGIVVEQNLSWSLAHGNADIDIIEGTVVTVSYDVIVLDGALAGQPLSNSAVAKWTGIDGVNVNERNGSGAPVDNDYFTVPAVVTLNTPFTNTIIKKVVNETFGAIDGIVRSGDVVDFELRLNLQEGLNPDVVVVDDLPQGLQFIEVVSINGDTATPYTSVAPFTHSDIATPTVTGDAFTEPTSVTWNIGNITNAADNNTTNNDFVIVYRVRIGNLGITQINATTLINTVNFDYTSAAGTTTATSSATVTIVQPVLTTTKIVSAAGGDTVIDSNELITYTVDLDNTGGLAPAYDPVLQDVIPIGLRNGAATITMVSTSLVTAGTVLANIAPAYDPETGIAIWNFDSGIADQYTVPEGDILRIVYQVQADATLSASMTMTNTAQIQQYTSLDNNAVPILGGINGVSLTYGATPIASTTVTTAGPNPLSKLNPATTTVSVGDTFSYRITIPAIPMTTALNDVRILDDLTASTADLSYVSVVKKSLQPFTPENTGTATNLVIEDVTNGIDIPAGQQAIIDITVQVDNTATNVSGLTFTNAATYTFNQVDNDLTTQQLASGNTTDIMTIAAPDSLTLTKTGPATIRYGSTETYSLNIQNTGTASAWDITVTDLLPTFDPALGGMCDTAPVNITAQMYLADGTTTVGAALVPGTDYVTSYSGCTLAITMQSAAAALAAKNHLIITYDAQMDLDTPPNTSLINVAGVTEWFSGDTAGAGATGQIKTYARTITDGTTAILDHEDAVESVSEIPTITIEKSVVNVTTTQDPGVNASPGDTLLYKIHITNTSDFAVNNFIFTDDLDALNATAMFVAGSLNLITVPAGADITNTNVNGGSKATGIVDIRNLSMGAAGSGTETILIEFEANLVTSITSGTTVLNQGNMDTNGLVFPTDDPNLGGATDPTATLITSAPKFEVLKTSADITGDATILLAGETLRYTITVKNIGNEDSINTILKDQLPANTTYVAGSTTLNGIVVSEPIPGTLPLQAGLLINASENTTLGYMRADVNVTTANIATITFDVVIGDTVVNGTIISNQGYVSASGAGSGPIADTPSDDPTTTATLNDPTLNVVGDQPLIDAHKIVSIQTDNNGNGEVDPGDILRYSITISNFGVANATGVIFVDTVPANTTYIANSVTLNTLPVRQPDAGVSPLIAGISVSSSDLTTVNGILTPSQSALVTFDVQVNAAVASGTVISNQGNVYSTEQSVEPTDADGIDSNGDQATLIVVGNAQLLSITKTVTVVGGGAALAGGELEYRIRVTNISSVAANNIVIKDDLDANVPAAILLIPEKYLTYVPGSGLLDGLTTGVSYTSPVITADYATTHGDLASGQSTELVFRATISTGLTIGTTITNTADVSWNAATQTANASVSIDVGGIPGFANINGKVWHDANFDNTFDTTEVVLSGWNVDIYRNTALLGTVVTDANGDYSVTGLTANDVGTDRYNIRFRAPGSTATTAKLGLANSPVALGYIDALHSISNIVVSSGTNTQNLNLPIDPNGTVYNSVIRTKIAGATISLLNSAGAEVPQNCFDDVNQQNQVTTANGYYKFDLNFSGACTAVAGDNYLIRITPPATGYNLNPSLVIIPQTDATTAALDVPNCPGTATDAIPATGNICEATTSELLPDPSVAAASAGTNYYLNLTLSNAAIPGDSQLFNNHLPIDPVLNNAVSITKTTSMVNVTRGKLVSYTITVTNGLPVTLTNSNIVDTYPAGFKYVQGSARLNGVAQEPIQNGLQLTWSNIDLIPTVTQKIKLLLIVGAAVDEGKYINQAQVMDSLTNTAASPIATATVRVITDPDFACSDVIGKVFDDKNLNGHQDEKEKGLSGVKLVTTRGLVSTTDKHGRFHVTCAISPNESRGSNFVIKLDERTLPSGYRVTTENPRVQRATSGKMLKFNFASTVHRVVSMDMADDIFVSNSTDMHKQWLPRIDLLIKQLKEKPSILRLSYLADVDDAGIVDDRIEKVKQDIIDKWLIDEKYKLTIEIEVFWRNGGPFDSGDID